MLPHSLAICANMAGLQSVFPSRANKQKYVEDAIIFFLQIYSITSFFSLEGKIWKWKILLDFGFLKLHDKFLSHNKNGKASILKI